jgi:hypothetical protein
MQVPVKSDAVPAGEQEPIQSKSVQAKSLKNDKLGVFAKILEGLIQNPKQGGTAGAGLLAGSAKGNPGTGNIYPGEKGNGSSPNAKRSKKVPISAGQENAKEALRPGNRSSRKDTFGFLETAPFPVPQETGKSDSIYQKEKKEGTSLQRLLSKTKPEGSPPEEAVKAGNKSAAEVSQAAGRTGEKEIKAGKSAEKEALRKVISPGSRAVQNKEEEAVHVSLNPRQVSENTGKESRGPSRIGEAKNKDKRREQRGNIEVRDFRSWEAVHQDPAQGSEFKGEAKSAAEAKTIELTVDLSSGSKSREEVFREVERRPAQAFENILARELHQNLNGDIVRQAQVVLRDHGEGIIRLALKPESLGNVKIQLEMAENKITGHIIVESNEALKAFEREIHSLEQAFKDSGFAGASLDTALASGSEGNGTDRQWRGEDAMPFFSERFAASSYDAISDTAEELMPGAILGERSGSGLPQVNMLV